FRCDFTCNDAVGCLKPRANRGLECLAPLLSEGIDLTLASLHDFATRAEITARLELIQHWVNRALCRTAASIRCFLNGLNDLITMHRFLMKHAKHEELRERH